VRGRERRERAMGEGEKRMNVYTVLVMLRWPTAGLVSAIHPPILRILSLPSAPLCFLLETSVLGPSSSLALVWSASFGPKQASCSSLELQLDSPESEHSV
jgi:hypothetical protein